MNVSAESAACRGKPVKSPVGHHHNLPEVIPFCEKKVNNNASDKMSRTHSIQGNIDWLYNTGPDPVQNTHPCPLLSLLGTYEDGPVVVLLISHYAL
jgi:hypothetical protein